MSPALPPDIGLGRPPRLGVLNQAAGGGATAVALDLASQARAAGMEVAIWPDDDTKSEQGLLRAIERFKPDLLHAHCFYNTWRPSLLAELSVHFPTVFTLHDVFAVNQFGTECWECWRNPWCWACPAVPVPKRWWPNIRVQTRLAHARAWRGLRANLVFPSEWMARRIARTALARLPHIVIPNAIDDVRFAPDPAARTRLAVDGRPLILAVGNMYSPHDDRKGYAVLFDAFTKIVRPVLPNARLVCLGSVVGLSPPVGAELLGDVAPDAVAPWYSAADVFTLPSLGDNSPVTVLEAMACGAAVVATRVGGIPEQVDDQKTGLLVGARDHVSLGLALLRMLQDAPLRARLGAAGRVRAQKVFGRASAWNAHHALYAAVVRDRRG